MKFRLETNLEVGSIKVIGLNEIKKICANRIDVHGPYRITSTPAFLCTHGVIYIYILVISNTIAINVLPSQTASLAFS